VTPTIPIAAMQPEPGGGVRYFEFIDAANNHRKFWKVRFGYIHVYNDVRGDECRQYGYEAAWGRIGTKGQSKAFWFFDDEDCANSLAARIDSKLSEGYVEKRIVVGGPHPAGCACCSGFHAAVLAAQETYVPSDGVLWKKQESVERPAKPRKYDPEDLSMFDLDE